MLLACEGRNVMREKESIRNRGIYMSLLSENSIISARV